MPYLFWMVLPFALMDAFSPARETEEKQGNETRDEEKQCA
jgi:hypothetical protein